MKPWILGFRMLCLILWGMAWVAPGASATRYPVQVTDAQGREVHFDQRPLRVVSLVPSATEILFAIGAQDVLQGHTIHDGALPGAQCLPRVGGYFSPSWKKIRQLQPDLLILAGIHEKAAARAIGPECRVLTLETRHLEDAHDHVRLLGRVFDRESNAEAVIARNRETLELIRAKTMKIPLAERKRVMRIMGRERLMAPGDDSFQNEMIRAAGGIPPHWGETGPVVTVNRDAWLRFDPEVIYGCGGDRQVVEEILGGAGWNEAKAITGGRIVYFPCDLTCRAATHLGDFVAWLASEIYPQVFADAANRIRPEQIIGSRSLEIDLAYVTNARVVTGILDDFPNKSLIIDFDRPQAIVSSLEGRRTGVVTVGNHYSPPPCWAPGHHLGLDQVRNRVYGLLGKSAESTSFLFTGADMDHLSVQQAQFGDTRVFALITAGVQSNAVRMSQDTGSYDEPGTINIILLSNRALSPRAMTRALISATEAKTAALTDLDIRSSATPAVNAATGTGTDNIIVVGGAGAPADNAGGHGKMGELIGRAVYAGVRKAILRQNGLIPERDVFQRLRERRIDLYPLAASTTCDRGRKGSDLAAAVEELLLEPRYAGFVQAALAVSDARTRELIEDSSVFESWCRSIASEIAGETVAQLDQVSFPQPQPQPLEQALRALFTGARRRLSGGGN